MKPSDRVIVHAIDIIMRRSKDTYNWTPNNEKAVKRHVRWKVSKFFRLEVEAPKEELTRMDDLYVPIVVDNVIDYVEMKNNGKI